MVRPSETAERVGFGLFEADLTTGELWKAGFRVKLQSQPFKVLTALLEKPGEVLSREELQARLWGKDAVGDFDHSLGIAVNKIRDALGDTADNPRFVETLARRGYRFIAPVTLLDVRMEEPTAAEVETLGTVAVLPETIVLPGSPPVAYIDRAGPESVATHSETARWLPAGLGLLCGLLLAFAATLVLRQRPPAPLLRIEQLTRIGRMAPGMQAMESLPASQTDGVRIFAPVLADGRSVLSAVDVHTGAVDVLPIPNEIEAPTLGDLSPDGSTLLLRSHLSPESEQPFWLVPTSGGSALRVANVTGHDATWMPDGKSVLYASGDQLAVTRLADGSLSPFATLPGRAFWLRWSPDGKVLRFTLMDPSAHTFALWEVDADGRHAHPLLSGWNRPAQECCGIWTGSGKYFVFQSNRMSDTGQSDTGQMVSDLWRMDGASASRPVRLTDGPMNFAAPSAPRTGNRVYFLGLDTQSVLLQYSAAAKAFVPEKAFLAGTSRLEYTRDGRWVTWNDDAGRQWRAHADGSERLQVTPDSLQVFLGHWSPDGRTIVLMAREPGKAWQIYTVAADGGMPVRLLQDGRNLADPSWSPDGRHVIFGRVSDVMGKEEGSRALEIFDLDDKRVTTVPGSEGLFSPRWSPDGQYIAALTLDQRRLMLFDTRTSAWRIVAETTAADPVWAADSKSIYIHASLAPMQPIYRVSVPDGRLEQVATLASFADGTTADYFFCGLTETGMPVVRSRTGTGNLYYVDLDRLEK